MHQSNCISRIHGVVHRQQGSTAGKRRWQHNSSYPVYRKEDNLQIRHIKAAIDNNGKLTAKVSTTTSGLQQDDLHSLIHNSSPDEQKKRLQRIFTLSNYEVPAFTYLESRESALPSVNETLELVANDYASITGKRLFIRPNIVSTYTSKLAETEKERTISYILMLLLIGIQ